MLLDFSLTRTLCDDGTRPLGFQWHLQLVNFAPLPFSKREDFFSIDRFQMATHGSIMVIEVLHFISMSVREAWELSYIDDWSHYFLELRHQSWSIDLPLRSIAISTRRCASPSRIFLEGLRFIWIRFWLRLILNWPHILRFCSTKPRALAIVNASDATPVISMT